MLAPEDKTDLTELTLLRAIVEGTATVTGDQFFRSLVYHLAITLPARYTFVAEFTAGNTEVRTLAFWDGNTFLDNFSYSLSGTPCEQVINSGFCHYPNNIQAEFPQDDGLVKIAAESYLGVPLTDAEGRVLGHLAVIDDKPMPEAPRSMSIFKIFAARARTELERKRAEQAREESEQRLARILACAMDAIITIDENKQITIFNAAAEKTFRTLASKAIGQAITPFLSPELNNILHSHILEQKGEDGAARWLPSGLRALRADGTEFPLEATISYVKVNNRPLYTIILRDINEKQQTAAVIEKLHLENLYLREELKAEYNFEEIVGYSAPIKHVFTQIEHVAVTDATVLIIGETGSGKELIARAIHNRSKRKNRPIIKVNCAALSAGLIESEFFGHEKGAFTGAITQRIGRFELANGGTIFLDEIGDISAEVQVKLLRVLQEQEFERVGGTKTIKVDVRVIAATNRDLAKAVATGTFRADLYYRLNVFPIYLPPLRERKEDISLLIRYFANKHATRLGKQITEITPATITRLSNYPWPGNIRELENVIERAVILCPTRLLNIEEEFLTTLSPTVQTTLPTMEEMERHYLTEVLTQTNWVIEGSKGAAAILNLNPNTLRSRIKKLALQRP